MNYLAHLLLASEGADAKLGALLGDFTRPVEINQYPKSAQVEILVHRAIDSFTDQHELVQACKARFSSQRRRYAGIVLDVYFDHLLAIHWQRFHPVRLKDYATEVYTLIAKPRFALPERLSRMLPYMIEQDWLTAYATISGFELTIERLATRVRGGEAMLGVSAELYDMRAEVEADFLAFFPQLVHFTGDKRAMIIQSF